MSAAGQLWKYKLKNNERIKKIHAFCDQFQDTEAWIMILEFSQSRWSLNTDLHKLDVFNIHEMVFELSLRFNAPVVTFARKCWEWF